MPPEYPANNLYRKLAPCGEAEVLARRNVSNRMTQLPQIYRQSVSFIVTLGTAAALTDVPAGGGCLRDKAAYTRK
jgi:hypothetical protein